MRKVIYTCDRCGREIPSREDNPMTVIVDFAMREKNDTESGSPAPDPIRTAMMQTTGRDYCYSCIQEIAAYMMNKPAETSEAEDRATSEADEERMQAMAEENQRLQQEIDQLTQRITDMKVEALAQDAKKAVKEVSSIEKKKAGRPSKKTPEEKAAEAARPKRPKKKPELDTGKIRALREAGWSTEEIALDMHMEEGEIQKILKGQKTE